MVYQALSPSTKHQVNNIMKAEIKNYNTTIAGLIGAGLLALVAQLEGGCLVTDWKCWVTPVIIAVLGFLARDASKSTEQSK